MNEGQIDGSAETEATAAEDELKNVLALVDKEIADQVAFIAAERARHAEAEQRHAATMGRLYSVRAGLTQRPQSIGRWLTYRDIAARRRIAEDHAPQAVRRARERGPIRERTVGRHRQKEFLEADCIASGLLTGA